MEDWEPLLEATLAAWHQDKGQLQALFDQHRSARMNGSPAEWIALNPMFKGVPEALLVRKKV